MRQKPAATWMCLQERRLHSTAAKERLPETSELGLGPLQAYSDSPEEPAHEEISANVSFQRMDPAPLCGMNDPPDLKRNHVWTLVGNVFSRLSPELDFKIAVCHKLKEFSDRDVHLYTLTMYHMLRNAYIADDKAGMLGFLHELVGRRLQSAR